MTSATIEIADLGHAPAGGPEALDAYAFRFGVDRAASPPHLLVRVRAIEQIGDAAAVGLQPLLELGGGGRVEREGQLVVQWIDPARGRSSVAGR